MIEPIRLTTVAEVDHLFDPRHASLVLILKHSLTCPISAMAFSAFRALLAGREADDGVRYPAGRSRAGDASGGGETSREGAAVQ